MGRLAEFGREGLLLLCGDSTNTDRPGMSPSESIVGPNLNALFGQLHGPHRRHLLRVEHPPRAAGHRRRRGPRPQGLPGRPLDAQEHQHRQVARSRRRCPTGSSSSRARSSSSPTSKIVVDLDRLAGRAAERAAPHGVPRPPPGRAARRRHGRLLGDADPRQRALGQRDDRPPDAHRLRRHHGQGRPDPRLRPRLRRRRSS